IILGRFNTAGNCGFSEIAEKSGLAIGAVKNDGMLVGIVVPVVFDPDTDVTCCADAGRACAKNSVIPRNSTRMRTVHLPRFENHAIQPCVVPGTITGSGKLSRHVFTAACGWARRMGLLLLSFLQRAMSRKRVAPIFSFDFSARIWHNKLDTMKPPQE